MKSNHLLRSVDNTTIGVFVDRLVRDTYPLCKNYHEGYDFTLYEIHFKSQTGFFYIPAKRFAQYLLNPLKDLTYSPFYTYQYYGFAKDFLEPTDLACYSFNIILRKEYDGLDTVDILSQLKSKMSFLYEIYGESRLTKYSHFITDFVNNMYYWLYAFETIMELPKWYLYKNIHLCYIWEEAGHIQKNDGSCYPKDPVYRCNMVLLLPAITNFITIPNNFNSEPRDVYARRLKSEIDTASLIGKAIPALMHLASQYHNTPKITVFDENGLDTLLEITLDYTSDECDSIFSSMMKNKLNILGEELGDTYDKYIIKIRDNLRLLKDYPDVWSDEI